jgi:hypothetical protein
MTPEFPEYSGTSNMGSADYSETLKMPMGPEIHMCFQEIVASSGESCKINPFL